MNGQIAVVIPAHDAERWLGFALESLKQQTLPPAEIVVVDDGSTDGTASVAARFGVRCVRQDQKGPGAARNRGVAETTAPFVAFLDADDWFAPAKLERQLARLAELGAALVCSDAWIVSGDKVVRCKNQHHVVPSVLTLERLLQGNPVICSTVLARRESIARAGGFDEDPRLIATEDYDLWLRMAQHEPIAYLAEPLSFYRVHPGSLSANRRFVNGVDRILDKVITHFDGEAHFQKLVARRRAGVRLDLAWDLLRSGDPVEARQLIRQAQGLAWSWKGFKLGVRARFGGKRTTVAG
ncbi:MAG: glycosyltransferase family 2 protein [Planctomycetes bacterium]|nr:glycosyltransferase family 2 protein [Planctomycetota bacterium]